jgi:RNA polymerase sigma-70 factor, ECF subfamily
MIDLDRPIVPASNDTPLSLLERVRNRSDQSSWQRLADLYLPLVERWLHQTGLSPADADDLTQEVMLAVVREMPDFEHSGRKGAFRTWLRTITVNRLRGYWRSKHTHLDQTVEEQLDQLADSSSDLARLWDREHDEFILQRLLGLIEPEFSPAAWHAFHRQTVDGLTAAQTASELGVSANAVLIAKSRVLRRLRQEAVGLID